MDAVDRLFDEAKPLFRRLLQSHTGTGSIVLWARNHKPANRAEYHEQRALFEEGSDAVTPSR